VNGTNDSISVFRGPLLYTLEIAEDWKVKEARRNGFDTFEVEPKSPWNYGLVVGKNADLSFRFETSPMPKNPFEPKTTPVHLKVMAKQLPQWTLAWNQHVAFDPPVSPVQADGPEKEVELVPAGTQMLRVTNFPRIGQPPPALKELHPDFAKDGLSRWIPYGGVWYVKDGVLHASTNVGGPTGGGKAVETTAKFSDFSYQADVTSSADGDAGLIFRVGKPSIGADAYTGYYVGLRPADGQVILGKANGQWEPLASAPASIAPNQPHRLGVVAKGPNIEIFLDGKAEPVLSFKDSSYTDGAIGVRQYFPDGGKTAASFSNIEVKAL
jgi:hypothetical protein